MSVAPHVQMELIQVTQLSNVRPVHLNVHYAHQALHAYLVILAIISIILPVFLYAQVELLRLFQLQVVFAKIVLILALTA